MLVEYSSGNIARARSTLQIVDAYATGINDNYKLSRQILVLRLNLCRAAHGELLKDGFVAAITTGHVNIPQRCLGSCIAGTRCCA